MDGGCQVIGTLTVWTRDVTEPLAQVFHVSRDQCQISLPALFLDINYFGGFLGASAVA